MLFFSNLFCLINLLNIFNKILFSIKMAIHLNNNPTNETFNDQTTLHNHAGGSTYYVYLAFKHAVMRWLTLYIIHVTQ